MAQLPQHDKGNNRNEDQWDRLVRLAEERMHRGLAPPSEIYRIENRQRVDWRDFPVWARPVDPQVFDGCCHEG
jgi:hypothetical protein